MARTYAGVLGSLAFLVSLARGLLHGGSTELAVGVACGHLLVFAVIGCVLGRMAQGIVDDAVCGRLAAELAAQERAETPTAAGPDGR